MRIKEFEEKVTGILKQQPMIGCTEEQEIKWKTHEIMKLAEGAFKKEFIYTKKDFIMKFYKDAV